jgi:hypothetical protein
MSPNPQYKTVSERHFAAYLENMEYVAEYEPDISEQTTKPDFVFEHDGLEVMCDVVERRPSEKQRAAEQLEAASVAPGDAMKPRARFYDPVKEVRHLIKEKRKKFKGYNGRLCALIMFNNGNRDIRLRPVFMFGAMMGNPGVQGCLSIATGVVDPSSIRSTYLPRGGSMVESYRDKKFHKSLQNVSAIIAMESFQLPNPQYETELAKRIQVRETQLNRYLSAEEKAFDVIDLIEGGISPNVGQAWGLTVCLNPTARIRFPDNVFDGPFDEHWQLTGDCELRIFAGAQRLEMST